MDFLQKVDFMMERYGLNKLTLSQNSGIPYTTIVGWYKKGYEGLKLPTLKKLSEYFNTMIDFWVLDEITDPGCGKADSFQLKIDEAEHIVKYRALDVHGKEAVDSILDIEYRRISEKPETEKAETKVVRFTVPQYQEPMSAGYGDDIGTAYAENIELIKQPPRGTSFIARVDGDSMEPDFHHGDWVFIHSQTEIPIGAVGVFYMDGKEYIKELGDSELISRNPAYPPRPMTEDVICQGLVIGICDENYFEQ